MDIPWGVVGPGSGWVLVIGVIVAFFRGKIWTDAAYQEKVHEANEWRTESRLKDQTISELSTHNGLIKEIAANVLTIMGTLHKRAFDEDAER